MIRSLCEALRRSSVINIVLNILSFVGTRATILVTVSTNSMFSISGQLSPSGNKAKTIVVTSD